MPLARCDRVLFLEGGRILLDAPRDAALAWLAREPARLPAAEAADARRRSGRERRRAAAVCDDVAFALRRPTGAERRLARAAARRGRRARAGRTAPGRRRSRGSRRGCSSRTDGAVERARARVATCRRTRGGTSSANASWTRSRSAVGGDRGRARAALAAVGLAGLRRPASARPLERRARAARPGLRARGRAGRARSSTSRRAASTRPARPSSPRCSGRDAGAPGDARRHARSRLRRRGRPTARCALGADGSRCMPRPSALGRGGMRLAAAAWAALVARPGRAGAPARGDRARSYRERRGSRRARPRRKELALVATLAAVAAAGRVLFAAGAGRAAGDGDRGRGRRRARRRARASRPARSAALASNFFLGPGHVDALADARLGQHAAPPAACSRPLLRDRSAFAAACCFVLGFAFQRP